MTVTSLLREPNRLVRRGVALLAAFTMTFLTAWFAAVPAQAATSFGSTLPLGATLTAGSHARSGTVRAGNRALDYYYELRYQRDGDLVLYKVLPVQEDAHAVWATRTSGAPGKTVLRSDGNLVVYGHDGKAKWASGTSGLGANRLVLQTNGNMVIRTKAGVAKWGSANGLCAKATIVNGRASSVISAACREVAAHTWYSFGGGHGAAPGRSYGYVDQTDPVRSQYDPQRKGFDCSGLTRWAYYRGTLRDMPVKGGTAYSQWTDGLNGTRIKHPKASALVVGDLLYFGANIHHTAIYLGKGYIVEAPQSNEHLKVSPLSSHGDLSGALRLWR